MLFEAARANNWAEAFTTLDASPDLINVVEPDNSAFNTLLHLAARTGAKLEIIKELINRGALRSIRIAFDQKPLDFAINEGHEHLFSSLKVPNQRGIDPSFISQVKDEFLNLFYKDSRIRSEIIFRPPQLEPLLEIDNPIRFVMWRFLGEAKYWIKKDEAGKPKLYLFTGSRFVEGSTRTYEISPEGSKRIR